MSKARSKTTTAAKSAPAPPPAPTPITRVILNGSSVQTMAPDYLYESGKSTLNGCMERVVKKRGTKMKINYKKMFG
tara:strand:- start:305 stop:532 length:228 start_codon:yes stop_codon:yes gene_type:complete